MRTSTIYIVLKSLPSVIKSPPSGHNWPKPIFNKVWLRRPLIRSLKMTIHRLTPGCCLVCVVCNVLLFSQTLRRTATDWRHEQSLNKELGSEIPNIRIGHYDGRSQNAHGHAYEDWLPCYFYSVLLFTVPSMVTKYFTHNLSKFRHFLFFMNSLMPYDNWQNST